ncbi:hypothetical protein PFISCL1PPCAC_21051, partial [Pristionchus fissidentatus]
EISEEEFLKVGRLMSEDLSADVKFAFIYNNNHIGVSVGSRKLPRATAAVSSIADAGTLSVHFDDDLEYCAAVTDESLRHARQAFDPRSWLVCCMETRTF